MPTTNRITRTLRTYMGSKTADVKSSQVKYCSKASYTIAWQSSILYSSPTYSPTPTDKKVHASVVRGFHGA